jgi:diguanylate cyclase
MALVILDVDHFKKVNDTHGHPVGDGVLKMVAAACQRTARNVDFVARYGGEEFVVIAPETDLRQSAVLAERLRTAIEADEYQNGDTKVKVTASLGVTAMNADGESVQPTVLIKVADQALYQAKQTGRNRICFAKLGKTSVVEPQRSSAPATPAPVG